LKVIYTEDKNLVQSMGALDNEYVIVIIGRDNFQRETNCLSLFLSTMRDKGYTLIWYQPTCKNIVKKLLDPSATYSQFPSYIRKPLKLFLLLLNFRYWPLMIQGSRILESPTLLDRCATFKKFLQNLGPRKHLVVLSRSIGGVIASRVVDDTPVHQVVCLGYPFKHPQFPEEPHRFEHLEHLKTPFLIIQGKLDEYGGEDVLRTYRLSPTTRVDFMDTDHDFFLDADMNKNLVSKVKEFLGVF